MSSRYLSSRDAWCVESSCSVNPFDPHEVARAVVEEVLDGRLGDQAAAPDDEQPVGGDRHLAHQVAGEEDGAALGGQRLQQVADPGDALGVQAVDRLIEQQHRWVAEQRGGDPQALCHAQREAARPLAGDAAQPDQLQHLVDPASADPIAERQAQQMVVGAAPTVERLGLQQSPDLKQRMAVGGIRATVDPHRSRGWRVQTKNQAHRRRLPGPVGAEESGHLTRRHDERQIVDGQGGAVALAEAGCLDHPWTPMLDCRVPKRIGAA